MTMLDRILNGRIKQGSLTILSHKGEESRYGERQSGWPDVTMRIKSSSAISRILLNPRLGMGEAYMNGDVTIDNDDIMGFIEIIRRNNLWENGGEIGDPKPFRKWIRHLARPFTQLNSLANSQANVAHHYDVSNDFYRLWLDDDMQYSCAYWSEADDSLERAQLAKKAHIAAKLALQPGQKVLDIGCGWGGMALYLNRVANVEVLGITLSEEQLKLARERADAAGVADKVRFELLDYRVLAKRAPGYFDRIVSVGMFEHVGVPQFETFFRACANLLKDDGVMLLHTIGRMGKPGATDAFTRKYIFPGGYIPALSETLAASEQVKLIHSDIENLRLHYALTLREWYARVHTHREAIEAQYGERFFRMWTFYLAGATAAFESGGMCNYQIQYIRNRRSLPITRDYIAQAERDLLAR
ncbi:SAM-dependent methyltransferase [Sphingorhabdus contaminans]|nr:cyclopropane-fatty-acyl-phospholipid synthase family protein [Sphingorhabdus contaminans]